jgi:prolipoprotein diacylglyceryltransferase
MANISLQPIPNLTDLRNAPAGRVLNAKDQTPLGKKGVFILYGLALLSGIVMAIVTYYNQKDKLKDNKKKLYMYTILAGVVFFAFFALVIYFVTKSM